MKKLFILSICSLLSLALFAQEGADFQIGHISFITSNNVYVKFDKTDSIQTGDTLLRGREGIHRPCLVVVNKSSTSCVCKLIEGCTVERDDVVVFKHQSPKDRIIPVNGKVQDSLKEEKTIAERPSELDEQLVGEETKPPLFEEKIRGRLSASSYSTMSSSYGERHRAMGRFSFRGDHLQNSPVSVETYLNYRKNFEKEPEGGYTSDDLFRVYAMALRYDVDSSMHVVLGRKINHRASSLGAIDGLQAEKYFGHFYAGAIVGFRPDMYDYSLNTDLFEYGGYVGYKNLQSNLYTSTTIGLLEQQNSGAVDRRYVYFQHNSIIDRALYIFSSFELDLYSMINEQASFDPRLTNLYLSARYRFSRKIGITFSYDSRRNIIYYETLKTEVERLLDDDEARQGGRVRISYRPIKYMSTGLSYNKRFQNNRQDASDNINGYVSHSKLPWIDGRLSLRYNWNRSSYSEREIRSFRYSRYIVERKLEVDIYYRVLLREQVSNGKSFRENYYGAGLRYRIGRLWMFSILYELSDHEFYDNQRINTNITRRFRS